MRGIARGHAIDRSVSNVDSIRVLMLNALMTQNTAAAMEARVGQYVEKSN